MKDDARNEGLPPPLDLLWDVGGRARRVRKKGLSVQQIVGAAVELADAGGLESVSMNRIAERVGFTTMATYRHVRSKDELVTLMVEEAVGRPSSLEPSPDGWRPSLKRWSRELQDVVRHHPWLVDLPLARIPFGPNRLAWFESGLRALAETSLGEIDRASLVLLLNGYVFSEARLSAEIAADESAEQDAATEQSNVLGTLLDEDQFPAVRRAFEAGIFDPSTRDRDADFDFGLQRILDGMERLIDERGRD